VQIPIEDNYEDMIQKAAVGQLLGHVALALRSNLSLKEVRALVDGSFDEEHARRLAPMLGLDADKLVSLAKHAWRPTPVEIDGLQLFNMPFPEAGYPDASVNCFLVYDQETNDAIAFDTGTSAAPVIEFVQAHGLNLKAVFLTHTHRDHVGGYEALVAAAQTGRVFAPAKEPYLSASLLEPDTRMSLCGFEIQAIETNGHSKGGMSYLISGLERPVAIVGDA
jgi:hydroxyacylglutathione hydrolase